MNLSCQATPLANRKFLYTETTSLVFASPGRYLQDLPTRQNHQAYVQGDLVLPLWLTLGAGGQATDFNITTSNVDRSTCQSLVNAMLPSPSFRTLLREGTGCAATNSNGTWTTGCQFSTYRSTTVNDPFADHAGVFGTADPPDFWGSVMNAEFEWTCSVAVSDPYYKNACCNVAKADLISAEGFDAKVCDPAWCLADPLGECKPVFDSCAGVSPCNRHWFLSNIPQPATDSFMATTTLLPRNVFSSNKGNRCYAWYQESARQAALRGSLPQRATDRVMSLMNTISEFCSDPHFKGQGECACINGYLSYGVPWMPADSGQNLEFQYKTNTAPFVVNQDAQGSIRRYDAFCSQPGYPGFTAPRSVTINGTVTTYSNACSSLTEQQRWSPLEYNVPSINPSRSIRSFTNYGDVASFPEKTPEYFGVDQGTPLPLPMPVHCWLPACVAEGVPDTAVFRNLWALGVTPCPPVCYQVSSGESINIQAGSEYAHIHENFVSCDFGYTGTAFPFSLLPECTVITVSVPTNYSNVIHIPVGNPTLETSSEFIYTTMSAFTNAYPIVAINGSVSITGIPISKYNYNSDSIYVMSVTIDTHDVQAFTSLEAAITLANEQGDVQSILFQITVWGPDGSATCVACDPTWGVGCPLVSTPRGTPVQEYNGRFLSTFSALPVLETGNLRLSSEFLASVGAGNRI